MTELLGRLTRTRYVLWGLLSIGLAQLAVLTAPEQVGPFVRTFSWQVTTGTALLLCIAYQWTVFLQRLMRSTENARSHYLAHRWVGVSATLLFAAHAVRPGHMWMTALSIVFIAIAVTGLLNREIVRYPKQWMYLVWLGMHMCLSAILVPLILVHVWTALAYQGAF